MKSFVESEKNMGEVEIMHIEMFQLKYTVHGFINI